MAAKRQRLPDFLVIGAMKSGTTTLYRDLESQPAIFVPTLKEPAVLVRARDTEDMIARYAYLFDASSPRQRCGEASTHYTQRPHFEGVADRAHALIGARLRLIYLVRHPVERTISHHYHLYSKGAAPADLAIAVRDDPTLLAYSRYAMQLEPWIARFGREAILVLRFEDYVRDRAAAMQRIATHVGAAVRLDRLPLEQTFNRGENRAVARGPWRRVANSWLYQRWIRPSLPHGLRQRLSAGLRTPVPPRPPPPDRATMIRLADDLADDAEQFARILGAGRLWDLYAPA